MPKPTGLCSIDGRPAHRRAKIGAGYWCHACYEWSRKREWTDPSDRVRHQSADPDRVCSVADCGDPHKAHGLCQQHYQAQRAGRPLERQKRKWGTLRQALLGATAGASDDCMFFEGRQERHLVQFEGEAMQVSRAAWTAAIGHPGSLFVLHACNRGSGDHGCINLRHLYLGDQKQNMTDAMEAGHTMSGRTDLQGEQNVFAKLTDAAVREARSLWVKGSRFPHPGSTRALALRYGVEQVTMKDVLMGRSWRHLL